MHAGAMGGAPSVNAAMMETVGLCIVPSVAKSYRRIAWSYVNRLAPERRAVQD